MQITHLEARLPEETLNHWLSRWIKKRGFLQQIAIRLIPGAIEIQINGLLPLLGSHPILARVTPIVSNGMIFFHLDNFNLPLIPQTLLCRWLAHLINHPSLTAEGENLKVNLSSLLASYSIEMEIKEIVIERGFLRLISGSQSRG